MSEEDFAKRLAAMDTGKLEELLSKTAEERALNDAGVSSRKLVERWFPMRDQAPGVYQVHEQAQLLAFRILTHAKNMPDAGIALRHLREAAFYAREAIAGEG